MSIETSLAVKKWLEEFSFTIKKNKLYLAGENWSGTVLPRAAEILYKTSRISGLIFINAEIDSIRNHKLKAKYDFLWGY